MTSRRGRFALALGTLAAALLGAADGGAQDLTCQAGDREVRALRFTGNAAFDDTELGNVVVTTPSSALSRLRVVGTRRCLDPVEFARDVIRLEAYYRKRGYPTATIDTTVQRVPGSTGRRVDVTFRVNEGAAQRLDRITVTGLAGVRDSARVLRGQPLRAGAVFDRVALEAFRDTIVQRLHSSGYPRAEALRSFSTLGDSVTAGIDVQPGPFTRIGTVVVRVDTSGTNRQRIPDAAVRRMVGVQPGDPYSAADIIAAQRTLYQTDAYRRVDVRVDTTGMRDSLVTLVVGLQEGKLHTIRASPGWATLDCFRVQGDFTDRFFLPRAQRLDVQVRLSRIGIGKPLGGAPQLCPQARDDPFSDRLNYYLGATVAQPAFFRLNRVPSLTLFTSQTSEYKAFRRRTSVGTQLSLTSRPGSRLPSTLTYQFELGQTEAGAVIFCAVFSACTPAERDRRSRNVPLGAIGYTLVRDATDDLLTPTRGSLQRITLRHSSAFTGSDATQRFNKVVTDASWYWRANDGSTFIAHVQLGSLLGRGGGGAPQQERLYAGGPTTVRGFRQNELGPAVYLASRYDTVRAGGDTVYFRQASTTRQERTIPTGGNTLVVANVEAQLRSPILPNLLQLALFTDAGEVWERGTSSAAFRRLQITPGAGVRVKSLFGVIRVDLGYNPYALRSGAAYRIESTASGDGQSLFCVSPGNTLAVTGLATGRPSQQSGDCPTTFQPSTPSGFLRRLNPSIWIGNAF